MRYARYLEPRDIPAAKHAVHRGQKIHCKAISEMQLFAARFHERHGDVPEARAAYGLVLGSLAPGLISAVLAHANFERRQVDGHVLARFSFYHSIYIERMRLLSRSAAGHLMRLFWVMP